MKTLTLLAIAAFVFGSTDVSAAHIDDAARNAVSVVFKQNFGAEHAVTVERAAEKFRFISHIGDYEATDAGIARQKKLSGWKGDFLFVRHQCGSFSQWRCIVDEVFTLHGARLVYVGSVESAACTEAGCKYDIATGEFSDLYDGLQTNPATGQVDTPPLRIARRAKDGKFVTDLDRSWVLNQDTYEKSIACLTHMAKAGFEVPCEEKQTPWSALVFAFKLTHYTGRNELRDQIIATHAVRYCERSADARCQLRVTGMRENFARLAVGDAPRYVPGPVTVAKSEPEASGFLDQLGPAKAIPLGK